MRECGLVPKGKPNTKPPNELTRPDTHTARWTTLGTRLLLELLPIFALITRLHSSMIRGLGLLLP